MSSHVHFVFVFSAAMMQSDAIQVEHDFFPATEASDVFRLESCSQKGHWEHKSVAMRGIQEIETFRPTVNANCERLASRCQSFRLEFPTSRGSQVFLRKSFASIFAFELHFMLRSFKIADVEKVALFYKLVVVLRGINNYLAFCSSLRKEADPKWKSDMAAAWVKCVFYNQRLCFFRKLHILKAY